MSGALYFVDVNGNFLGGFAGAAPPQGAVAVPTPPADARQVWSGSAWSAVPSVPPAPIDARLWIERLSPQKQLAVVTFGLANPALMLWLLKAAGSQVGIILSDPDTPAGVAALVAAGALTTADQTLLLTP